MGSSRKVPESFEHLRIKEFLYMNLPNDNHLDIVKLEHNIGNRIADVYLKFKDGNEVVIEIQHSKITIEDIKQRTKDYTEKGLYVIWILDGITFNRYPYYEENVLLTKTEKELHKMYRGRVYYMNLNKEEMLTPLYPLHFAPFYKRRIFNPDFYYYSKSMSRNSIIPGSLSSLKIRSFRNFGYRLARFLDPDIRRLCYEVINIFIQNYDRKFCNFKDTSNLSSKLDPRKAIIYLIVRKFQPVFGLHLLYDILRRMSLILKKDFHFLKSIHNFIKNN
jgi:hypothetical protein